MWVGTAIFGFDPKLWSGFGGSGLEYSSLSVSGLAITSKAVSASPNVKAKTPTQSNDLQAGTTPEHENTPTEGLIEIKLFNAAGTRVEPAVSVVNARQAIPLATTLPEPELEPPETCLALNAFGTLPYGDLTPTNPVANWSKLVLPMMMAPSSLRFFTTVESLSGVYANDGQAAVVSNPLASMLSFTATGTPYSLSSFLFDLAWRIFHWCSISAGEATLIQAGSSGAIFCDATSFCKISSDTSGVVL